MQIYLYLDIKNNCRETSLLLIENKNSKSKIVNIFHYDYDYVVQSVLVKNVVGRVSNEFVLTERSARI